MSRLSIELSEKKWEGVSHRYTRYCVIDCILSTTSCQKILKNCSPFVFVDWFFAFVDVLIPYVVHRIFTYRCENSHKNSHGIRDFRPLSSMTSSLPLRSSITLRWAHRHHRSRSSCILWKVKRPYSRWSHAQGYGRVSLSRSVCDTRTWVRYTCSYSWIHSSYPRLRIRSASPRR